MHESPCGIGGHDALHPHCRYTIFNKIGEGTYGVVFLARDRNYPTPSLASAGGAAGLQDEGVVAMKRMRLDAHDEGVPVTTLREVALLKDLQHENIVRLREVCRQMPAGLSEVTCAHRASWVVRPAGDP